VSEVLDQLAAERSLNVALAHPAQIKRARELLEAAGLGHLRPEGSWRPRAWADRLAAISYPEDQLVDELAQAIYAAHWHQSSPTWTGTSEEVRNWLRTQARSALVYLRRLEKGSAK
jgi:hypothetical protein